MASSNSASVYWAAKADETRASVFHHRRGAENKKEAQA
jgi:hypothetical protein